MANPKYDGVVEAVHYTPDGQVDWVRAYLRRGAVWSDRVILRRQDLIQEIKTGRKMMLGSRIEYLAGTFQVTKPVNVATTSGREVLTTSNIANGQDNLEGALVL